MDNIYTRRFETLEKNGWMLHDTDDLLYGAIQMLCTCNPNEPLDSNKRYYITKQNYTINKQLIMDMSLVNNTKTLKRHLDKLIEKNLLIEFEIKLNDKIYPCYGVVVNYNNPYQIINTEWLKYLYVSKSSQSLRVYFYLLDKYKWKEREKEDKFVFTETLILEALGYSASTKTVHSLMQNILKALKREGIIDYVQYYEQVVSTIGVSTPTPKYKLLFVADSEDQLRAT